MPYRVILKSINNDDQTIVLDIHLTKEAAEQSRKNWRRVLGGKNWTIDRRPGLDTLDHLGLKVVKEGER